MVATSLVLVLSTPSRATRHVGRFHQLVDLHVDRCHRSRLRRFHQSGVEPRHGIGDRRERRCIDGEILRQLLPQKVCRLRKKKKKIIITSNDRILRNSVPLGKIPER